MENEYKKPPESLIDNNANPFNPILLSELLETVSS